MNADGVTVPMGIAFEYGHDPSVLDEDQDVGSGDNVREVRFAASNYQGHSMIIDPNIIENYPVENNICVKHEKTTPDDKLPELAYGQDYQITCGYQAPGGLMPTGLHDPLDPTLFKYNDGLIDQKAKQLKKFRRTIIPGAPRLLIDKSESSQTFLATCKGSDKVRPLWKEFTENWTGTERRKIGDMQTLFLNPGSQQSVSSLSTKVKNNVTFFIRPPLLDYISETKPDGTEVTKPGLIWKYWDSRDKFFGDTSATPAVLEDQAVVGKTNTLDGFDKSKGGIFIRVHKVGLKGLMKTESVLINLSEAEFVTVTIEAVKNLRFSIDHDRPNKKLTINVPAGQQYLFEAMSACDENFFTGDDIRFRDDVGGEKIGDLRVFSSTWLAIEALPDKDHLPDSKQLWNAININEGLNGEVNAYFSLNELAGFDFIGEVTATWQNWVWDGGPVSLLNSSLDFSNTTQEASSNNRTVSYVDFEKAMFRERGRAGSETTKPCSARSKTLLFSQSRMTNRGADYLRLRLKATSRYAPLQLNDPNIHRDALSDDSQLNMWKGCSIGLYRSEPLPSPRISVVSPLFKNLKLPGVTQNNTTSSIAIFLDDIPFHTRSGGGIVETLEARIQIEKLDKNPDVLHSHAIGLDPIRASGSTGPTYKNSSPKVLYDAEDKPIYLTLKSKSILGLTLEPDSPFPLFNSAVAFFEPRSESGINFNPDTIAKIQLRTTTLLSGTINASPWTGAVWVHFLPQSATQFVDGDLSISKIDTVLSVDFANKPENFWITSHENIAAIDKKAPYLISTVQAILFNTVVDYKGDDIKRVVGISDAQITGTALSFTHPEMDVVSDIRLLQVKRVSTAGMQTTWFPDAGIDAPLSVTAIGPLITIK